MPQPFFLHMLGIPGAGKTTFLSQFEKLSDPRRDDAPRPVLLGFDQVMQAMPEYRAFTDKIAAFAACELPAREKGYQILKDLLEKRDSVLFDNGGSAASHVDILKRAADAGYKIILVSVTTDINAAQKRVDSRAVAEGRHTPLVYLEERAQKIAELEQAYRALTPHFFTIENKGDDIAAFIKDCTAVAETVLNLIAETPEASTR